MSESLDLSEFEKVAPPRNGTTCWADKLTPEQEQKVLAARVAGYSYKTISKVVTGWGIPVSEGSVNNHLTGVCKCPKN